MMKQILKLNRHLTRTRKNFNIFVFIEFDVRDHGCLCMMKQYQYVEHHSALATCLILLLFQPARVMSVGVPDSWKMTDRFIGYRYELVPAATHGEDIKAAIRGEATFLSYTSFL
jgi:hypothetical protein